MRFFRKFCTVALKSAAVKNAANNNTAGGGTNSSSIDLERIFTQDLVQRLFRRLTGCQPQKIFRTREIAQLENAKYILMTEDDVKEMEEKVKYRCEQRLRPPPFKYPRKTESAVISFDPDIADFDNTKFVFTDIDPEVNNRERLVVVREVDGTLRTGTDDERDRMNRVYFPKTSQQVHTPEVFQEPYFSRALSEKSYEFLLEWACVQFEPDNSFYVEITQKIFDHINLHNAWDILYSTRFYANLVFHLVTMDNHEKLLKFYLKNSRLDEAADLVKLYFACNPNKFDHQSSSVEKIDQENLQQQSIDILIKYAKEYTKNKSIQFILNKCLKEVNVNK